MWGSIYLVATFTKKNTIYVALWRVNCYEEELALDLSQKIVQWLCHYGGLRTSLENLEFLEFWRWIQILTKFFNIILLRLSNHQRTNHQINHQRGLCNFLRVQNLQERHPNQKIDKKIYRIRRITSSIFLSKIVTSEMDEQYSDLLQNN